MLLRHGVSPSRGDSTLFDSIRRSMASHFFCLSACSRGLAGGEQLSRRVGHELEPARNRTLHEAGLRLTRHRTIWTPSLKSRRLAFATPRRLPSVPADASFIV